MSLATLLVVEDDPAIRRGLADALRFHSYDVREAADGKAGLSAALTDGVDLVLLDILMPKMDGLTVLAELRKARPALPVIVLTARGQEEDRVRGLKLGADDYVVKPFGVSELLARVEAVLRRSAERPSRADKLEVSGRVVDFLRREVIFPDGSRVELSPREGDVLAYLAANRGRAVSREELISRIWGFDPRGVNTRTVDMTVARLRELLRDDHSDPKVIATVRAKGYMLAAPSEAPPAAHPRRGSSGAKT
jgi:two-component system alkaline phosphatase synthesis response regulator PhoP